MYEMYEFDEQPNLKQFSDLFNSYIKEIGLRSDGTIDSHTLVGEIDVFNENTQEWMKFVGLKLHYLPGCACPCGISIHVKSL